MRFRPVYLLVATAVLVVVMAALATSGQPEDTPTRSGDRVVKTLNPIDTDATASFEVVLREGDDAEHEAEHIFDALAHPGIGTVALDVKSLTLVVTFDSAAVTEEAIREQLLAVGYLRRSLADATPTEVAPDGSGQSIHLVPGKTLSPSFVRAVAGVPLTITFSAGSGHLAAVSIPSLEIRQDISTDGARIEIPDPAPGTYELVCEEGYPDATIVVE